MKDITFLGDSLKRLREFPESARREAGVQLFRVQNGYEPADWKPMKGIGSGAREIRVRDDAGAFRVIFVASIGEQIYVLHAFQKTSKTTKTDIDLAAARYRQI